MENLRPTVAEIDLHALRANALELKKLAGRGTWFCPMVKADGYGHGSVSVGRELEAAGVDALGVALVEEGLSLRQAGLKSSILVFGLFNPESAAICSRERLTPVVSRWEDLDSFLAKRDQIAIHLKFNTGMNRLGFAPGEAKKLAEFSRRHPQLRLEGICSHLAHGDDWRDDSGHSAKQARCLREIAADFPHVSLIHLLNSAALLAQERPADFGCRPGIALYGAGEKAASLGLKPVMHLRSQIGWIHRLKAGEGVSYGAKWRAPADAVVGVIPIGYADGIRRILSQRAHVLIRGQRLPLVGTICMDYVMVDLTGLAGREAVAVGESATFWGEQDGQRLSADEVAEQAETIAYEIFTGVSRRVPRHFVRGETS